jgi:N-methylhydantoinase B
MADYFRPDNLNDALALLAQQSCRILAGGTDVYPAEISAAAWGAAGPAHPQHPATLDISRLADLRGIQQYHDRIEIGALTTWSEALTAGLPDWFEGVRLAAREVGGRQIQNRGTLAGNLCNASPAADGIPPLLALDARVRLQSSQQQRELPLGQFILGNRHTARNADELVSAIVIPRPAEHTRAIFLKLGARRYLVISIAMVALTLSIDDHAHISHAAVAAGACSAVARRLPELERRLIGVALQQAAQQVHAEDFKPLAPIADIRASAEYRLHSAGVLVRRGLQQLAAMPVEHAA